RISPIPTLNLQQEVDPRKTVASDPGKAPAPFDPRGRGQILANISQAERRFVMKLKHRWSLVALGCAVSALGCRPAVNSAEIAETPEGKACGPEAMIEEAEDNNNQDMAQDGRGGYMYTFVDKVGSSVEPAAGEGGGVFAPRPGGAQGSQYAMCMKGTVGTAAIVYTGMGLNFVDPKGQYDATKYKGISFWAKKGPGSTGKVRLKVPDVNTDP